MISTCPGIDKYAFYLDFKGVLSSKPQVSVKNWPSIANNMEIITIILTNSDLSDVRCWFFQTFQGVILVDLMTNIGSKNWISKIIVIFVSPLQSSCDI
jgi:hypothetical protein